MFSGVNRAAICMSNRQISLLKFDDGAKCFASRVAALGYLKDTLRELIFARHDAKRKMKPVAGFFTFPSEGAEYKGY